MKYKIKIIDMNRFWEIGKLVLVVIFLLLLSEGVVEATCVGTIRCCDTVVRNYHCSNGIVCDPNDLLTCEGDPSDCSEGAFTCDGAMDSDCSTYDFLGCPTNPGCGTAGQSYFSGSCSVPPPATVGACGGVTCASTQVCCSGSCVDGTSCPSAGCGTNPACTSSQVCCSGSCVDGTSCPSAGCTAWTACTGADAGKTCCSDGICKTSCGPAACYGNCFSNGSADGGCTAHGYYECDHLQQGCATGNRSVAEANCQAKKEALDPGCTDGDPNTNCGVWATACCGNAIPTNTPIPPTPIPPTPTSILDPPHDVTASCTDPNGPVTVSWGASTNAYKYVVSRRVAGYVAPVPTPTWAYEYHDTVTNSVLSYPDTDTGYDKYKNNFRYNVKACRDNTCADSVYGGEVIVSCPINISCSGPSRSPNSSSLVSGISVTYNRGTVGGQYSYTQLRYKYLTGGVPGTGINCGEVNYLSCSHEVNAASGDAINLVSNIYYTGLDGNTYVCYGENSQWNITPYGNAASKCENTCRELAIPIVTPTPVPTGVVAGCSGATGDSPATEGRSYGYQAGTVTGLGWAVNSSYQYATGANGAVVVDCAGANCSHVVPAAGYTTLSSWTDLSKTIGGNSYVCKASAYGGYWSPLAPNAQSSCSNSCLKTVPVVTPVPGCTPIPCPGTICESIELNCTPYSYCSPRADGNPAKVNPTFGSTDQTSPLVQVYPSNVTLTWEESTDPKADYYEVGVWDSVGNRVGGVMLVNDINTVSKLMAQSYFTEGEVYHWHIKVKNNTCSGPEGDSDWSQPPRYFVERYVNPVWAACSGANGAPQPAVVGDQFTYNSGNVTSSGGESRAIYYNYDGGAASSCVAGTSCTKTVTSGTNLSFWTDVVMGSNTCQGTNGLWTPTDPNNNPLSTCVNSCRVVNVSVVTPTPRPTDPVFCSTCNPLCGQSREAGCSDCPNTDGFTPGVPTLVSPIGTDLAPVAYDSPATIPLVWNAVVDGLADKYWVGVWDVNGTLMDSTITAATNYSSLGSKYTEGQTYHWQVNAINDTCTPAASGGLSDPGWFKINVVVGPPGNLPPQLNDLIIRNSIGTSVAVDAGNKNHICDSRFLGNRNVIFEAQISDPNGIAEISSVSLRWNGRTYNNMPINQSLGIATTTVDFTGINDTGTYSLEINIVDGDGASNNWLPVYRSFKSWDCQVAVAGTLYDGSDAFMGIPSCGGGAGSGFTTAAIGVGYSLTYVVAAGNKEMTVTSPTYSSGGSPLVWDKTYSSTFGGLGGLSPRMNVGGACLSSFSPSTLVSAYNVTPMDVDFSVVLNQDAWYQVAGGGVRSKVNISDLIPVTCAASLGSCVNAISIGISWADGGLVAAPAINKGCPDCTYGIPPNDWHWNENLMGANQYNYTFFTNGLAGLALTRTFAVGTSLSQIGIGTTGVVLVNGDVTIDVDNMVNPGDFLMVVAKDDIDFMPNVNNSGGVFVAGGNIDIGGTSNEALTINGVVYSAALAGEIKISRSFTNMGINNTTPAVVFKYRPDFIFSMPSSVARIISGWNYN